MAKLFNYATVPSNRRRIVVIFYKILDDTSDSSAVNAYHLAIDYREQNTRTCASDG